MNEPLEDEREVEDDQGNHRHLTLRLQHTHNGAAIYHCEQGGEFYLVELEELEIPKLRISDEPNRVIDRSHNFDRTP